MPPQFGADPILNVQAETDISGYRVIVSLSGNFRACRPWCDQEPGKSLPQADVVSLITTGSLSRGDASLAQTGVGTATSLIADTIINAAGATRDGSSLWSQRIRDRPIVDGRGGAGPTARLTVGRQINRNLGVTYSTDFSAKQNQVIALEYRLGSAIRRPVSTGLAGKFTFSEQRLQL
ncbi:MAG: translocation/assembly module TamB domain-containing protein [Pyrinomonadaceae bacterium]